MDFISFGNIVEENGKTIRENNLLVSHNIPVGTLVEVKYDEWHGDGACAKIHARLWVVEHTRDCDGTPLYALSAWTKAAIEEISEIYGIKQDDFRIKMYCGIKNGFSEKSLTVVEVTKAIRSGEKALQWEDESEN